MWYNNKTTKHIKDNAKQINDHINSRIQEFKEVLEKHFKNN